MNVIFHHPLPLNPEAKSASGIRPLRMLKAFDDLGCDVDLVTGYSSERTRAVADVKRRIRSGYRYDFVYAESSTMPTILADTHHLPLRPFLDWRFFRFCNANEIPIGLFYRDIYWLFDGYGTHMSRVKANAAKAAFLYDLYVYKETLTRLYLPSTEMARYVPLVDRRIMSSLPPGHSSPVGSNVEPEVPVGRRLRLFYVGGMSDHYRLHKLFQVVRDLSTVELTVCTREAEWQKVKNEYPPSQSNIKIIHETGDRMEAHLRDCDVAVLFVQPQEYREFAAPVKLFEYLGFRKPILASDGTLAGRFVRDNQIGWTIPYDCLSLRDLLVRLTASPAELVNRQENMVVVSRAHTWRARAQQVIEDLV